MNWYLYEKETSNATGPGFKTGGYGTLSTEMEEDLGRIYRSDLTQDIKLGSCVFQCDVPHLIIMQTSFNL